MDTRRKIVTAEEAVANVQRLRDAGGTVTAVSGYFDPLLAEHAGRLENARAGCDLLVAVVASPPQPVLPAAARAELVAALRAVDCVVVAASVGVEELLARIPATTVVRFEEADAETARDLIRHVRNREDGN